MDKYITSVEESVNFLQGRLPWTPDVCLMLGTGLGGVAGTMDVAWSAPYGDIPHFPVSTAPEHAGRLVVGTAGGTRVALFQGRFHYYEGYTTRELTFPVRVMAGLGTHVLIGCNVAGGLNLDFSSGDLMLITDHINMIPDNPLRGANPSAWGLRFPDLSGAYSRELRGIMRAVAGRIGITLQDGVFVAVPGPSLETPAETRFLRMIGADAVAMSLVPEVIVARHAGMEVLGISVIANINDPDNFRPILIEDVIEQAKKAEKRLEDLLLAFLGEHRTWNG
jgi:purine-nucleoside phosphorylase